MSKRELEARPVLVGGARGAQRRTLGCGGGEGERMSEDLYEAAEKKNWQELAELAARVDNPDAYTVRGRALLRVLFAPSDLLAG